MSALRLVINHEEIGMREFTMKADDNPTIDMGGYSAELSMNGDGTANKIRTRKVWEISGINIALTDFTEDVDFIQSVVNSLSFAEILYEHDDGITYRGLGMPTGEIKATINDKYLPLTLSGPGELKPLV